MGSMSHANFHASPPSEQMLQAGMCGACCRASCHVCAALQPFEFNATRIHLIAESGAGKYGMRRCAVPAHMSLMCLCRGDILGIP